MKYSGNNIRWFPEFPTTTVSLGWLTLFIHCRPSLSHILVPSLSVTQLGQLMASSQGFLGGSAVVCSTHFSCFLFTRMRMSNPCKRHTSPLNEYIFINEMWACPNRLGRCFVIIHGYWAAFRLVFCWVLFG